MMMSVLNDATLQNIKVEISENWEVSDSIEHLPPSTTSEQPRFGMNTDQCYVPGEVDCNSSCVPKFEFEEIMIKIENDSEMKPELTEDPMCSDVTNNDVFSSVSTQILSEEYDKNRVISVCVPKSKVSSKKHSASFEQSASQRSFPKLSKKQRSCVFCGKTYVSLIGLQEHNKFLCSFQKTYTLVCKLCGSNFQRKFKATKHIKTIHNIHEKQNLKLMFDVISADELDSSEHEVSNQKPSPSRQRPTNSSFPELSEKEGSCVFCGETCVSLESLQMHNMFYCSLQKRYTVLCKVCGSNWGSPYLARQHIKTIHNIRAKQALESLIAIIPTDEPVSPEHEVINLKASPSGERLTHNSFPKLSKEERSCSFCGKTCVTLPGLQIHNKFYCSLQKSYTVLCKLCGSEWGTPYLAKKHIKRIHNIGAKQTQKSLMSLVPANDVASSTMN